METTNRRYILDRARSFTAASLLVVSSLGGLALLSDATQSAEPKLEKSAESPTSPLDALVPVESYNPIVCSPQENDATLSLYPNSTNNISLQAPGETTPKPAMIVYIHEVGAIVAATSDGHDRQEMTIKQLQSNPKTYYEVNPPSSYHFSSEESNQVKLEISC